MKIFSDERSQPLWDAIHAINDRSTENAVYLLGCRCQQLEAKVDALERRLVEAENINQVFLGMIDNMV
jgi:hypothetical protein